MQWNSWDGPTSYISKHVDRISKLVSEFAYLNWVHLFSQTIWHDSSRSWDSCSMIHMASKLNYDSLLTILADRCWVFCPIIFLPLSCPCLGAETWACTRMMRMRFCVVGDLLGLSLRLRSMHLHKIQVLTCKQVNWQKNKTLKWK